MAASLQYKVEQADGGEVLVLEGPLRRDVTRELSEVLTQRRPGRGRRLELDLSAVTGLDSASVAAFTNAWRQARDAGGVLHLRAASKPARRALAMFRVRETWDSAPPAAVGTLESLGGSLVEGWQSLVALLQLAADTTAGLLMGIVRPRLLRPAAVVEQAILIGSQALPIVGLISFLVGLTLAFQSAYQLRQFGAAIFVANLAAVAMVREMGPLMTAILVAGRSGSSIAAEIATMKVSEEVDALTTMGLDPVAYLALPKLVAILITVPLLTVLADVLGVLGGFLVGVLYLDISPVAFLRQTLDALIPKDLLTGLLKSLAFAWGIGIIGLYQGFKVRGGAAEVGRTTTSSVVAAIFYIIVADCFFSVIFYILI